MKITITGRHMTVTPALRRHIEERARRLDRYGVRLDSGQFVLSVEKHRHAAEGVVGGNGRIVQGRAVTREMYASIDRLLDKLERQLVKHKEKREARRARKPPAGALRGRTESPAGDAQDDVVCVAAPVLALEEALARLRASRGPGIVAFEDAATGSLRVAQRAGDGRIELIGAASTPR